MECKFKFLFERQRGEATSVGTHRHDCYELVYYIKGAGKTKIAGIEYSYQSGSFSLIGPNTLHDERRDEATLVLFIGFTYEGSEFALENGLYHDTQNKDICSILKKIKREIAEQRVYYQAKLLCLTEELVIELIRTAGAGKPKGRDLSYIINFMEENSGQYMDMKELSALSGYSYHHFRHLFKARTGLSPQSYLIDQRVKQAARLLETTDLSVLEIALECGFSNESQLCLMFRRAVGETPGRYRKQRR